MNLGVGNFDFSAPVMQALLELRPKCIRIEVLPEQHEYAPGKWRFPFRDVIQQLNAADVKVMLLVGRSTAWNSSAPANVTDPAARHYWPMADPADWLEFLDRIIEAYGGIEAIEVENEKNDVKPFSPEGYDPRGYARRFWLTRAHLKAIAPHIKVVTGGTKGVDINWYRDLQSYGIEPDEIAVHTYELAQSRKDRANKEVIEKLDALYEMFGLPIRITEFGWAGVPGAPSFNSRCITGLRSAFASLSKKAPYVSSAYLFTFNWSWSQKRQGTGYGMLDPAGNKLPLFDAFRELVK